MLLAKALLAVLADMHHRPANANELEAVAAIAETVDSERPVFGSALEDAVVMLEMAERESNFRRTAIGDRGSSFGPWQLQRVDVSLAQQWRPAAAIAYARLRVSVRECPESPLAIYVSGSCGNRAGRRVSAFRMREVERLVASVESEDAETEEATR